MPRKIRRPRHEPPKVWHNPDVVRPPKGSSEAASAMNGAAVAPTTDPPNGVRTRSGKIVVRAASAPDDPAEIERQRLLEKLRAAESRIAITQVASDLERAGFVLTTGDQIVQLQLLEHHDEAVIRKAIGCLDALFATEPPKRRPVLEARLRRLVELADEPETCTLARALWRRITGRTD